MTDVTDGQLMERLRSGDRDAFGCLVDRHKDALVNALTRMTGSRDRAQDLAQETFLRLYRGATGYLEQGRFQAYLYRIAVNLLRGEERRKRRWRVLTPALTAATNGHVHNGHHPNGHRPVAPAEAALLRGEVQQRVSAALAQVPMRFRVPLVLHAIEGWPYEEIARALATREGTVKSRISRGRRRLQEILTPEFGRPA